MAARSAPELGGGELQRGHGVVEGKRLVEVAVGEGPGGQVGAQASRVEEADVRRLPCAAARPQSHSRGDSRRCRFGAASPALRCRAALPGPRPPRPGPGRGAAAWPGPGAGAAHESLPAPAACRRARAFASQRVVPSTTRSQSGTSASMRVAAARGRRVVGSSSSEMSPKLRPRADVSMTGVPLTKWPTARWVWPATTASTVPGGSWSSMAKISSPGLQCVSVVRVLEVRRTGRQRGPPPPPRQRPAPGAARQRPWPPGRAARSAVPRR